MTLGLRAKTGLIILGLSLVYVLAGMFSARAARVQIAQDQWLITEALLQAQGEDQACASDPTGWSWEHPLHGRVVNARRLPQLAPMLARMSPGQAARARGLAAPWQTAHVWRTQGMRCDALVMQRPKFDARSNDRLKFFLSSRVVLGGLIALVLWLALASPLVRRIRRMAQQAQRITREGFEGHITPVREDELGQMAQTFNDAARTARTLLSQQAAQETLLRTTLAQLSHDVRTPLATLKLGMGRLNSSDPQDIQQALPVMRANLEHLDALFSNFSTMVALEESTLPVQLVRLDLGVLVSRVLVKFERMAQDRDIALSVSVEDEPLWVQGDPIALEQLLSNLVHNALRHAHAHIAVLAFPQDGAVLLEVRDDGPGYAPSQPSEAPANRLKGWGLVIVRQIAHHHHADFDIAPVRGDDPGTLARLTLPSPPD